MALQRKSPSGFGVQQMAATQPPMSPATLHTPARGDGSGPGGQGGERRGGEWRQTFVRPLPHQYKARQRRRRIFPCPHTSTRRPLPLLGPPSLRPLHALLQLHLHGPTRSGRDLNPPSLQKLLSSHHARAGGLPSSPKSEGQFATLPLHKTLPARRPTQKPYEREMGLAL